MEELSDATGVMEVDRTYSYGLDLIAQDRFDIGSSAWNATFYLYDGHGNVRALADDAGTITDTYDYDAFGTLIEQLVLDVSASGLVPVTTDNRDLTTDNQYLYCGEQFDPDLGLYFLRARYMDTERGRFWSMDTFEGWRSEPLSLHKYLYAHANPVMSIDPSGKMSLTEVISTTSLIVKAAWSYGSTAGLVGETVLTLVYLAEFAKCLNHIRVVAMETETSPDWVPCFPLFKEAVRHGRSAFAWVLGRWLLMSAGFSPVKPLGGM